METLRSYTTGASGAVSGIVAARRPVWQVTLITIFAVLVIFATLISVPQTSGILKSTFFPEGRREISGPQLTAAEQKQARDILLADSRIQEILAQGAAIDTILPIYVEAETLNPVTGGTEIVRETWAQAWIVRGSQDWGVQVDLVRGQVVSITE